MLSAAFLLLLSGAFYTLRLSLNTGSFPKPLSAEEERYYLALASQGDLDARNVLIERNLRLVAHILKILYFRFRSGRPDFNWDDWSDKRNFYV